MRREERGTVTVSEAAKALRMTELTLRILMRQGKLPIGYVKTGPTGRCSYYIYSEMLKREMERQRGERV